MWRSIFNSCKIVLLLQILTLNGLNKEPLAGFVVGTDTDENNLEAASSDCKVFPWGQSVCGQFSPLCDSDGKMYKNRCEFQEALCYNSSLLQGRKDEACSKQNPKKGTVNMNNNSPL